MSDPVEPEEEDKDRTQVTVVIGIVLCLILGLGTVYFPIAYSYITILLFLPRRVKSGQ